MAKICVVPDWLAPSVSDVQSAEAFAKDFASAIESRQDVINYHRGQLSFLKILLDGRCIGDSLYSMYQTLFVHELPDMPEIELLARAYDNEPLICDDLAAGSGVQERLAFSIECSTDGNTVYTIGKCVDTPPCGETVDNVQHLYAAKSNALLAGALGKLHNRVRAQDGFVDKASAFRDNCVLTQLYVESLCS